MTTPLSLALDGLARLVDGPLSDGRALGAVVARLERAAGADLGPTADDPAVVLARRFARAHRLLAAAPGPSPAALDAEDVCALTRLLRGTTTPGAAPTPAPAPAPGAPAPAAVPVGR